MTRARDIKLGVVTIGVIASLDEIIQGVSVGREKFKDAASSMTFGGQGGLKEPAEEVPARIETAPVRNPPPGAATILIAGW